VRLAPVALLLLTTACAARLAPRASGARDAFTTDTLALGAAIDLGARAAYLGTELQVVCIRHRGGDPTPAMIVALQRTRSLELRVASACVTDTVFPPRTDRSLISEAATGKRGIIVGLADSVTISGDSIQFSVRYYQHALSSAEWQCNGVRRNAIWVLAPCRLRWIS
jgi:hypothetical protein